MTQSSSPLPVIIAGAGPCGLVAALTLQKKGVPFILVEKAGRHRICSNAGSGFDLAATALDILHDRLGVPLQEILIEYAGMYFETMSGQKIRDAPFANIDLPMGSVMRADLQNLLLKKLFPTPESEEDILKCGAGIESYEEESSQVTVKLMDNSTIVGSALLGCDGINSKVRKGMHGGDENDPLAFGNCICYWGKTAMVPGSELSQEVDKTQTFKDQGLSFVIALSEKRAPGCTFCVPYKDKIMWALFIKTKDPPKTSDDMTRRGGWVLDKAALEDLQNSVQGSSPLLDTILAHAQPEDITEAGMFDRKNLALPYSSPGKRVVLLGDSAHPQTPFLGQGANMAIVDAYVVATRIAVQGSIKEAVEAYDIPKRRKEAKKVVMEARSYCKYSVSSNRFVCWGFKMMMKMVSMKMIVSEANRIDKTNRDLLKAMEAELGKDSK